MFVFCPPLYSVTRFKIVKDADSGRPLLDVESAESKWVWQELG
jgi:hypothetical protein